MEALNGNGNRWAQFWRTVALMALSAFSAGLGAWLAFDRDQPSRAEVRDMVNPTASEITTLRADVVSIRSQLDRINGKLDVWLNAASMAQHDERR